MDKGDEGVVVLRERRLAAQAGFSSLVAHGVGDNNKEGTSPKGKRAARGCYYHGCWLTNQFSNGCWNGVTCSIKGLTINIWQTRVVLVDEERVYS